MKTARYILLGLAAIIIATNAAPIVADHQIPNCRLLKIGASCKVPAYTNKVHAAQYTEFQLINSQLSVFLPAGNTDAVARTRILQSAILK